MADEPTGALDSKTGLEVLKFLQQLNKEGSTVILITHDNGIAATARRCVRLADGKIIEDHAAGGGLAVNILQAFKMAWKSIAGKKGRSALTILSIFIGIAAVMTIVSVMEGMKAGDDEAAQRDGLEPPYRLVCIRGCTTRTATTSAPTIFRISMTTARALKEYGRRRDAEQTGKCHRGLRHEEQRRTMETKYDEQWNLISGPPTHLFRL